MSRVFTKNTANYMSFGVSGFATILSGKAVFSMSAKVRISSTTTGANDNNVIVANINGTTVGAVLNIDGTAGAPKVRISARSVSTDARQVKSGATTIALGVDTYIGGIVNIAADTIEVYLNGVSDGSVGVTFANATWTLGTPTGADTVGGYLAPPSVTTDQFAGFIGEIAIWSSALSPANFASLAAGTPASSVAAGTLVYYNKITGIANPEPPTVGSPAVAGAVTGSLPQAPSGFLQARSGIARSGVTYAGWAPPVMTFQLAGSALPSGSILYENFSITQAIDSHTSLMTFTMKGTTPVVGNDIKVTYTTPNVFEFAGTILQIRSVVKPGFKTVLYECTATGYLWLMDTGSSANLVTGRYNCGASTAVTDILFRYASGFRVGYIPSSLGDVSMNFSEVRVSEALNRIATAVRANWEVSVDKVVSMYNTYPEATLPTITNATRLIDDLEFGQDLTQVRTRTFYVGGGSECTADVPIFGTSIHVNDLTPYLSTRTPLSAPSLLVGEQLLTVQGYVSDNPLFPSDRSGPGTINLVAPGAVYPIASGTTINLVAAAAADASVETALAATLGTSGFVTMVINEGVQWFDESYDRAQSDIYLFQTSINEFNYTTVNREVKPGRLQPVSMTSPFVVSGSFLIQQVEITTRGAVVSTNPTFYRKVTTSPWRLSMMNLLRGVEQM